MPTTTKINKCRRCGARHEAIPKKTEILDYQKIDKQTSLHFNKTIVEEDDLVLSVRGATIGKLAVVPKILSSSNINANLLKISLNKEICNPYFFWYYCQSRQGRKDF